MHASQSHSLAEMLSSTHRFPAIRELQRIVLLCNAARSTIAGDGTVQIVGVAVDVCLLNAFGAHASRMLRASAKVLYERRSNEQENEHIVVLAKTSLLSDVAVPASDQRKKPSRRRTDSMRVMLKAAPETLFPMLSRYIDSHGECVAIDRHFVRQFNRVYQQFTTNGCILLLSLLLLFPSL